jgi:putative transposase
MLCANYSAILLPKMEVSTMVRRKGRREGSKRKISRETARAMLTWSHWQFRSYLLTLAAATGTRVILVNESYTSKTCGICGWIHHKLGGQRVYHCRNPECRIVLDRDINGARNILLKWIAEYPQDFTNLVLPNIEPASLRNALTRCLQQQQRRRRN